MSDNTNPRNKLPLPGGQPDRFQPKVLLIWLGIFVLLIALWSAANPSLSTHPAVLTMQEMEEKFGDNKIHNMKLRSDPTSGGGDEWYVITGEMDNPNPNAAKDSEGATVKFTASGRVTELLYTKLTAPNTGVKVEETAGNNIFINILISLLPWFIIVLVLYYVLMRQFKMAGRGAMAFGKSRARMLTRDRERMTFADVAGCDEAKEEVQEVVEFLKDPKKFQRIGGRIPRGVLMVGPPGTGKTLLAKAVAGEAEVPFFSISGSDFVEMFVGVGAARVRDMFEQGRKSAPCIIFIDEIDAVGRQRGAGWGGGNDEREQTLNSLLVEMDGFDGHEGVIIIAATNRPDVLDSALLRPGRFDRQITIDLPDLNGRAEILKVHAKKIKLNKAVDLLAAARSTTGFSGADLANLLNESALIAARHNKSEVEMADIHEARDKISFGRERRKLMDAKEKESTAYHEAGHAIIQAVVDDSKYSLHKVTIIPRGRALGLTMSSPIKDILTMDIKNLQNRICSSMAGRIAEILKYGPESINTGASSDIKQATTMARHMVCDLGMSSLGPIALGDAQDQIFLAKEINRTHGYSEETARRIDSEIHRIVDEQYKRAEDILTKHRDVLDKVAAALVEYETIEGKHVLEILNTGAIVSPVLNNTPAKPAVPPVVEPTPDKSKRKGEELGPGSAPAGMPA